MQHWEEQYTMLIQNKKGPNDMNTQNNEVVTYVEEIVARAKKAQKIAEKFSQEKVDELATALAWGTAANEDVLAELAALAFEETQLGDYDSKIFKMRKKIRGSLRDVKHAKTVGIIEEDIEKGLVKIAKPVGVIGALIPSTQPEMSPVQMALCSVKGRNAMIYAPHPRGKKTTFRTVEIMREILKKYGAPEDLLICVESPTLEMSHEIMKQSDLVMATGGTPMVKAAYSSGTPAYGVGAGNAVIIVDETADLKDAAHKIMQSKTFDLAAGCSCDNSIVIQDSVYDEMIESLEKEGGYLASSKEKELIQKAIWPNWPKDHVINRDIVAKPVKTIADIAGISVPEEFKFIMVEETGTGVDFPFSGEKMCLVVAIYRYNSFDEAIAITNACHVYSGAGHSCGIFSFDDQHIEQLALKTYTTRVVVRQPQSWTNTGDWTCGMPFTCSLGCGTWGGNIVSENIVLKHYLNTTWVIRPIPAVIPTEEELFGDLVKK